MKNRIIGYLAIYIFAAILVAGCATAPKKPDQTIAGNCDYAKEYITWLTRKQMKKNQVVGLSIAIIDDQGLWTSEPPTTLLYRLKDEYAGRRCA